MKPHYLAAAGFAIGEIYPFLPWQYHHLMKLDPKGPELGWTFVFVLWLAFAAAFAVIYGLYIRLRFPVGVVRARWLQAPLGLLCGVPLGFAISFADDLVHKLMLWIGNELFGSGHENSINLFLVIVYILIMGEVSVTLERRFNRVPTITTI